MYRFKLFALVLLLIGAAIFGGIQLTNSWAGKGVQQHSFKMSATPTPTSSQIVLNINRHQVTPTTNPLAHPTVVPTMLPKPKTNQVQNVENMPAVRNPLDWPFARDSIWNMPLGSNAMYVDATIGSRGFGTDIDWFIPTSSSDPLVPTYMPNGFGQGRCAGNTVQQQAQWHPEAGQPLHVPANLVIPDAITSGGIYSTPNSTSAFLEPDGKTLVNFNVTARCQPGGPLYGTWFGQSDLYGDGIAGGHGGSALSSIGGSIRTGELLNNEPIHHALKVDLWGNWLHYNATSDQGHRWPAPLADGGAPQQYKGTNPALVMGSLLALPPNVTPESLGVTSQIGKKVFQALQNYGAYVVDDTGGDYNALCVEQKADVEFKNTTGHTISQDQALSTDFNKMIAMIKVINNNAPTSIGGGGTPRVPLAPPFA
ncbi:hypothetical protein [Dictyobacter alpinus]|nr:hypothetical protein [Dictyobacter alpinus]